jgi:nucleoredoxin
LVTSDKNACDVCSSDREAIRSVAPAAAADAKDLVSLLGSSLIGKGGVPVSSEQLKGKVVALYFGAGWCAPCRALTPQFSSIYTGATVAAHPFEVVFVSADRDVDAFNQYFASMPWLAVKFSNDELRKRLAEQHAVTGIPTIIVLDAHGCVITTTGRADLARLGDSAVVDWISRAHKH